MKKSTLKRSALPGGKPTTAAPSIDELLAVSISRREAFECGHLAALEDEICDIVRRVRRQNPGRSDPELFDTDVTIPYWVLRAVDGLASSGTMGGRKSGKNAGPWHEQYRADLVRWHRYALVKQALDDGAATWSEDKGGYVFAVVAAQLEGTRFAGGARAIKESYLEVVAALERGEAGRFYRARTLGTYDALLSGQDAY